jgi:Uma2 family endonuclease
MSEAEYLALPEEKPYLEYVDGMVVQKAMPDRNHSRLANELGGLLREFAQAHGGEATADLRALQPDRQSYRIADTGYLAPGTPDGNDVLPTLAVEVRSPDETIASQQRKCVGWIEAGVREAWLVEPRTRTIEVFEADGQRRTLSESETLRSKGVPGLEIDLASLFKVLDR